MYIPSFPEERSDERSWGSLPQLFSQPHISCRWGLHFSGITWGWKGDRVVKWNPLRGSRDAGRVFSLASPQHSLPFVLWGKLGLYIVEPRRGSPTHHTPHTTHYTTLHPPHHAARSPRTTLTHARHYTYHSLRISSACGIEEGVEFGCFKNSWYLCRANPPRERI